MKLVLLISIATLAFMSSCDVLNDFEDETYEMEPYDASAATSYRTTINKALSGTVKLHSNPDNLSLDFLHTILTLDDTLVYVDTLAADTVIYPPTDAYIFTANELLTRIDTLLAYDTTFVNDTTFTIDTSEVIEEVTTYTKTISPASSDTTYFVLEGVNTGEVVFYFNDYIRTHVYDLEVSEEPLEILDKTIPLELSSGIFTIANRVAQPVVKSRYVYELQSGKSYLVGIQKLEQTLGNSYNTVIINK